MKEINAAQLIEMMQNGSRFKLLDVREEIEYHTYNIGGINLPLSKLTEQLEQSGLQPDDEIVVVCKVGLRSETAQSILIENGYHNVSNLAGGLLAVQKLKTQS